MEEYWKNRQLEDLPGEVWVDVFGFDGIYEVSNKGRIRSVDRLVSHPNGDRMMKGRVLSQVKIIHKYSGSFSLYVRLANGDATYSNKTMASLVLNSFRKPDKYNDCTHHINGVSHDNRLENLTFEDLSTKRKIEYDIHLRDGVKCTKHWKDSGWLDQRAKDFDKVRSKRRENGVRTYEKRNKNPVTVYMAKNKFIGTYSCLKNASEQLAIKEYILRNSLAKQMIHIQVKEGIFDIEGFSPKPNKKGYAIRIGDKKYTLVRFSERYNIPSSTLYYKIRTLSELNFRRWVEEKTSNTVNFLDISVQKASR